MKFTIDIPDSEIEAIVERKFSSKLAGKKAPIKEEPVKKKASASGAGPILRSLMEASDRIPSGSRRQGIRFKLGGDHVETSIEMGLKGEVERYLGDRFSVSKACHAVLVLLLEEARGKKS